MAQQEFIVEFEFTSTRADGDNYTVQRPIRASSAQSAIALVTTAGIGFSEFGERFTDNCVDWRIRPVYHTQETNMTYDPAKDLDLMTNLQLRAEYAELTGNKALNKWLRTKLIEMVEVARVLAASAAERKARHDAEEAGRAQRQADTEARKALRADLNWRTDAGVGLLGEAERDIERIMRKCDYAIQDMEMQRAKLIEGLAGDMLYALSWSKYAFEVAAKGDVMTQVRNAILSGVAKDVLIEHAQDQVASKAKYPAHSSSPTSNLAEQYTLAAWANFIQDISWI